MFWIIVISGLLLLLLNQMATSETELMQCEVEIHPPELATLAPPPSQKILFLDTETTGLPLGLYPVPYDLFVFESCRILQIGWILASEDGTILQSEEYFVKPPDDLLKLPPGHPSPHLLEEARERGVPINEVLQKLEDVFQNNTIKCIVGHNIPFDLNVIIAEINRWCWLDDLSDLSDFLYLKGSLQTIHPVCTMRSATPYLKLAQKYPSIPGYKWPRLDLLLGSVRTLTDPFAYPEVVSANQTHTALDDVKLTVEVYNRMKILGWL